MPATTAGPARQRRSLSRQRQPQQRSWSSRWTPANLLALPSYDFSRTQSVSLYICGPWQRSSTSVFHLQEALLRGESGTAALDELPRAQGGAAAATEPVPGSAGGAAAVSHRMAVTDSGSRLGAAAGGRDATATAADSCSMPQAPSNSAAPHSGSEPYTASMPQASALLEQISTAATPLFSAALDAEAGPPEPPGHAVSQTLQSGDAAMEVEAGGAAGAACTADAGTQPQQQQPGGRTGRRPTGLPPRPAPLRNSSSEGQGAAGRRPWK